MITNLGTYAHFTNTNDMDEATKQHLLTHLDSMNTTERAVLDMIFHYYVKHGASNLKHETIEQSIKKSKATVRRAIRKLEKFDIIECIHYIRPVMSGLGANIYVIKPYNEQSERS